MKSAYQNNYFLIFQTKHMLWVLKKNRLNETVLLSNKNICLKVWVRKYLQFYAEHFCLSKPMDPLLKAVRIIISWLYYSI